MNNKAIRRIFSLLISITLIVPSFLTPFKTYAADTLLEITSGQLNEMGDTVSVRVTDSEANTQSDAIEKIIVKITSSANSLNGTEIVLTETDPNSAVFEGTFKVMKETNLTAVPPEVGVLYGDIAHIAYKSLSSDISILPNIATSGDPNYYLGNTVSVSVMDRKLNVTSTEQQNVTIKVSSISNPQGMNLLLNEQGNDSFNFVGYVTLSDITDESQAKIFAQPGDRITFTYTDSDNHIVTTEVGVNNNPQPGDLTITVKDPTGTSTVSGARVELRDNKNPIISRETDSNGAITFDSNIGGGGQVELYAYPPQNSDCAFARVPLQVENGIYTGGPIIINLNTPMVEAQIQDPEGNPLNDGNIEILQYVDQNRHTSWISYDKVKPDGSYMVPPLEDGYYCISAYPSDNPDYVGSVRVDFMVSGNQCFVNNSLIKNLSLNLRTTQVKGAVTDPGNGNAPVESRFYRVNINPIDQSVDMSQISIIRNDGSYKIGGLAPGSYVLRIMKNDFEGGEFTSSFSQILTVPEEQPIICNLEMTTPQITGTVINKLGEPISEGRIEVLKQNKSWNNYDVQIRNESYKIGGLEDGIYYLKVQLNNLENWGYPEYDTYDLYKIVINGGICIDPSSAVTNITVDDRQPRIDWIDTIQPGFDRICAHIINQSLLGDTNELVFRIVGNGSTYNAGPGFYSYTDPWQDKGDIQIDISQLPILPYGKYSLEILKNGLPIEAVNNNNFFVLSGTFTDPPVVPASDFAGQTYTVDVTENRLGKVYPWESGDTVFVRLNQKDSKAPPLILNAIINQNETMNFTIPDETQFNEGWYYLDFFEISDNEENLLAQGELEIGTAQIKEATARQGESLFTFRGDFLRKYMYPGAYVEVSENGQVIAKTQKYNNFWGNMQWFIPFHFLPGVNYTADLFVPGQGQILNDYPIEVVPYLRVDDPIIDLGSPDSVLIRANLPENGWTAEDSIKVNLHGTWENSGISVKAVTVSDNAISLNIPENANIEGTNGDGYGLSENNYIVEIINGTTGKCMGYTFLYAANDPTTVIQGSVVNADGSPAQSGIVYLSERYGDRRWESIISPDGEFCFNRFDIPNSEYRLMAQPAYDSAEAADFETISLIDGGYSGSLNLQYNVPQVMGKVEQPDGAAAYSGFVNISDREGNYLYSVSISPKSTFRIGGLEAGKYFINGSSDGSDIFMDSSTIEINVGSELLDVGTLRLNHPQFSVNTTADGRPVNFDVFIQSIEPGKDIYYETRRSNGTLYIGKLEKGTYYVTAISGEVPYSQSEAALITIAEDGTSSDVSLQLSLTEPKLIGEIHTPAGDLFTEGHIEIFSASSPQYQFIGWIPVNADGKFYMGGIPDGEYYLRACINEESPDFNNFSASSLTRVILEQGKTVALALNDKSPRFKNIQDVVVNQDRMRFRLINTESANDYNKFTAEILDSNGNPLPEPLIITGAHNFHSDGNSFDRHVDEIDVEIFIEGGLRLKPGQYKLQLKYDDKVLDCDDSEILNVRFGLFSNPGMILPDHTEGVSVIFDIDKDESTPYPWDQDDEICVNFYGSYGQKITQSCTVHSDGKLLVILPQMDEDNYRTEVVVNGEIAAIGGFTVGYPVIESINDMLQGDDQVFLNGRNLFFYTDGGSIKAQILKDDTVLLESSAVNFNNDSLVIDFNDNLLAPGEYSIKIWFNGVEQVLPNSGKFFIALKLYPEPSYVLEGYGNTTLTLKPRQGTSPTWNAGDSLKILFFGPQNYVIEPENITIKAESLVATLPLDLPVGNYWVSIQKIVDQDNLKQIAALSYEIIDTVQIEGVVRSIGNNEPIPYAEIDVNNDSFGVHVEADAEGNYHIFGLPEGKYRIQATAPDGQKYVSPNGDLFVDVTKNSKLVQELFLQPASLFRGTVSLPEGQVAPEGGSKMGILVWTNRGTDDNSDDVGFWNGEVVIPEGSNSTEYKFLVSSAVNDYLIGLWLQNGEQYIKEYYFKDAGVAFSKNEATRVNGISDQSDLNFNIIPGDTISGTVHLPPDAIVPDEGIDLQIIAAMKNSTETNDDDYVGGVAVHIPKGQTSESFMIPVPINPEKQGYTVYYELSKDYAFLRRGFAGDGYTTEKEELAKPVSIRDGSQSGINLTLIKPQLAVTAASPEGYPIDFFLDIQPVSGEYSNFEASFSEGSMYVWGLAPGDYHVYGLSGNISYSQSEPGLIHIDENGVCSPNMLALKLTTPKLSGQVRTHSGEIFNEGYVEVFSGTKDKLQYIVGVPIDNLGQFSLGGLADGTYYIRARIHDQSGALENNSASSLTEISLPSSGTVTLTLNDKSARFRNVRDVFVDQDRTLVRLVNVSSMGDLINSIEGCDNLVAEIQDIEGNVKATITGNNLIIDSWTYDKGLDEVDLEILFNGLLDLNPGQQYRVTIKDGVQALTCDDYKEGIFNVFYRINTVPYVITPEKVSRASVTLELQSEGSPDPLTPEDDVLVKIYDSLGKSILLKSEIISGRSIEIILPEQALPEGWYQIEVSINEKIAAMGGLAVGYPQVDHINDMAEGDSGITVTGKNLEFFNNNPKAYAKIFKDGTLIYKDDHMNFEGQQLYIEFSSYNLKAGEYTLELGCDGVSMSLPNDGKFRVVKRLYSEPVYAFSDYGDQTIVTLRLRTGETAPWTEGDTLNIGINGYRISYVIDDAVITKTTGSLSFVLPNEFPSGQYNMEINRILGNSNQWIGTCRFGIADFLQVSGKIIEEGGSTGVAYAGVNIYNDNRFYHFDADTEGNYYIYGLQPGSYKMQATPPMGSKYISPVETEIIISDSSLEQNINLVLQPLSIISGKVSLPEGEIAPQGGLKFTVAAFDNGGTPENPNDDHGYFYTYVMDEGFSSLNYRIKVDKNINCYRVAVWVNGTSPYIGENFYSSVGTVYSFGEAEPLDASEGDKPDINITLARGETISGTVTLPPNVVIPSGGIDLEVVALMDNGTDTNSDDYAGSVKLNIPQGKTNATYSIALPPNPSDKGYMVIYILTDDYDLERRGFYSENGTVSSKDLCDTVDILSGDKIVDLNILPYHQEIAIVSYTPDKSSPQILGEEVTFTVEGTGGAERYYQFWINDGSGWIIAQPYSTTNTFIWTPMKAGNYQIGVWVKDKNSANQYDKDRIIEYSIESIEPVTITGFTTDKVSPQAPGTSITITANATGGSERYYQFWIHDGTAWSVAQPYSTSNTYSWTPLKAGNYQIGVWVKDKNSPNQYDKDSIIEYSIGIVEPIVITGLTTDKVSPQGPGASITVTANATGGSEKYYQFWIYDGTEWLIAQPYSTSNTYCWSPSKAGNYQIGVWVKDQNSTNQYDKDSIIEYSIGIVEPIVITGLTTDKVSPQAPGTSITVTANVTGGSEKYYQFWIYDGTEWLIAQPYSTSNTYCWSPSKAGNYQIGVWVKDKNSTNQYDKDNIVEYSIGTVEPIAITGLITDKVSPQQPGTSITITANATGGSERYYQFWIYDGTEWVIAQAYSTANTYRWTPTKAGNYKLGVWVKDKNSTNQYDKDSIIEYSIGTVEPIVITGLTTDKVSPQQPGASITVTANATGGSERYYEFWLNDGTGWIIVQPYSTSNVYSWIPTKAANYQVGVRVKDKNSVNQYDKDSIIQFSIGGVEPIAITGLITDKISPQAPGTSITVTANATGGTERYYEFWLNDGTGWIVVQPYSTSNVYSWIPTKAANYQVGVRVKDKNSANQYDKDSIIQFNIGGEEPVVITGLTVDKVSPQAPGTSIIITANASGGSERYYQFWIYDGTGWFIAQPYSTSSTCSWTPSKLGDYKLGVWVKDKNSSNQYDMDMIIDYSIGGNEPVSIDGLVTDEVSPQAPGTAITITATATGGSERYYQFWIHDGTEWIIAQPYSTSNICNWTPSKPGNYKLGVWVKDKNSPNQYDVDKIIEYSIQ